MFDTLVLILDFIAFIFFVSFPIILKLTDRYTNTIEFFVFSIILTIAIFYLLFKFMGHTEKGKTTLIYVVLPIINVTALLVSTLLIGVTYVDGGRRRR